MSLTIPLSGLTFACVLGGDAIEKQFASIHSNPDVIFATPGRFVHICLEMSLKLNSVEFVVFDEADRLFEMGLGDQLREILARLPDTRYNEEIILVTSFSLQTNCPSIKRFAPIQ